MNITLDRGLLSVRRTDDPPYYKDTQLLYHIKNAINKELGLSGRYALIKDGLTMRTGVIQTGKIRQLTPLAAPMYKIFNCRKPVQFNYFETTTHIRYEVFGIGQNIYLELWAVTATTSEAHFFTANREVLTRPVNYRWDSADAMADAVSHLVEVIDALA